MGQHLLLTIRLQSEGQGCARYHGMAQGASEWPPSPARVFQALVAGSSRGSGIPRDLAAALEWLERLPPPIVAAPRAKLGSNVSFFVPNNDADALKDPRDVSSIRTRKAVQPILFAEGVPFLYAWPLPGESPLASAILNAAQDLYQLGRGVDMAWAEGEVVEDEALERRLREHGGTLHLPEPGASGRGLACPMPGSLRSLELRYQATRFREEVGKPAKLLFTNAPKARFLSVVYERAHSQAIYELRDREDEARAWPWPLHRVVKLIEGVRDGAAARLREGLPDAHMAVEQTLVGRKADGSDPSPLQHRARFIPLPSIGHEHADHAVRRILLDVPSGASVRAADLAWALAGLEISDPETGIVAPFVLSRAGADDMLRHYSGPSRRWRSVTAIALPEASRRRRIEPARQREEAKSGAERIAEEERAVAAVHVALRHAGIRRTMVAARVQREPFEARGSRVEAFAEGTRFSKERLWHVELELDRPVEGPLVIGDGRFLGLGVMAPVAEPWTRRSEMKLDRARRAGPTGGSPTLLSGIFGLRVIGDAKDEPLALARALRRAVMARAQAVVGSEPLGRFFTGHEADGAKARADHASHLAFHWDPAQRRLLVIAPHCLDRRESTWEERRSIEVLAPALEELLELRPGSAGRLLLQFHSIVSEDPLLVAARSWTSVTPYAVTRHKKRSSAAEVILEDVIAECQRRGLPRPRVTVLEARGVPGQGLEGRARLDFEVAVNGPVVLGRTRYLGGGLFAPAS